MDGISHFIANFNRTLCKQKVETLIRRHVLWRLIWVCTVCLCTTSLKDTSLIWVKKTGFSEIPGSAKMDFEESIPALFANWVILHVFAACWFFSKSTFSKNSFRNTTRVAYILDLNLIWIKTVYKGYQQAALGCNEFKRAVISDSLQFNWNIFADSL